MTYKPTSETDIKNKAMQVLIAVRQHLRKKKDFESLDLIRDLLIERKISLEDFVPASDSKENKDD